MKPKPLSSENHLTVPVVRIAGLLWLSNRRSATLRSSASCATSGLLVFAGTRPAAVALRRSEGRSEGPATSASNSDSPIWLVVSDPARACHRRSFRTRLHLADRPPAGARRRPIRAGAPSGGGTGACVPRRRVEDRCLADRDGGEHHEGI